MRSLTAFFLGLALLIGAGDSQAAGLGQRSPSARSARRGRISGVRTSSNRFQRNRARNMYTQPDRQPVANLKGRPARQFKQSYLSRAGGAFFGRTFRDGATLAGGRIAVNAFDRDPEDEPVARQRGQRIAGYAGRTANAVRRLLTP